MTTTALVEGKHITKYHGVVTGEAIIGANAVRDLFAGLRDFFGGRSGSYEEVLRKAKDTALREMGEEAPGWVPTRSLESTWIMKRWGQAAAC